MPCVDQRGLPAAEGMGRGEGTGKDREAVRASVWLIAVAGDWATSRTPDASLPCPQPDAPSLIEPEKPSLEWQEKPPGPAVNATEGAGRSQPTRAVAMYER